MAKKEKEVSFPLVLTRSAWQPKDSDGNPMFYRGEDGKPDANKPVLRYTYYTTLEVLGRKCQFRVLPKVAGDKETLDDFFILTGKDELPIVVTSQKIANKDTGEVLNVTNVQCRLSEKDDIHVVNLKPCDDDKGRWNMAVRELANHYELPAEFRKVREERKAAAEAAKKEKSSAKIPF